MLGYLFLWWLSGFIACAWSFEWDIKKVWLVCVGIGFFGPLCFVEAYSIRNID